MSLRFLGFVWELNDAVSPFSSYGKLISLTIVFSGCIYVVVNDKILHLKSCIVIHWVFISYFLYPFLHWWAFMLILYLAVVNNTSMNTEVKIYLIDKLILLPLGIYSEVRLLDHMVVPFLILSNFQTAEILWVRFSSAIHSWVSKTFRAALDEKQFRS